MKKILLIATLSLIASQLTAQRGIGTANPSTDAVLHLVSSDSAKGIIIPIVTTAKRPVATAALSGMLVYNITDSCMQVCNGVAWNCLSQGTTTATSEWTDQGLFILATRAAASGDTVVVSDNGRIGIGTTNPTTNLHIKSKPGNSGTVGIKIENAGTGNNDDTNIELRDKHGVSMSIGTDVNDVNKIPAYIWTNDGLRFGGGATGILGTFDSLGYFGAGTLFPKGRLHVNGSGDYNNLSGLDDFIVTPSGNVGIGTATPTTRLDVISNASTVARVASNPSINSEAILRMESGGTWSQGIDFGRTGTTNDAGKLHFYSYRVGGQIAGIGVASDGKGTIIGPPNDPSVYATDARLNVVADTNPLRLTGMQVGTSDSLMVINSKGIVQYRAASSLGGVSADSAEWTDHGDYILARRAGAAGDTVVIRDNGRVGIGITNPTRPLHVYSQETVAQIESFGGGGTEAALFIDAPNAANNGGAEIAYRRRGTDQIFTGILKSGNGAYSVSRTNDADLGALSRIDTSGTYRLHFYGDGDKEAGDLSVTATDYLAGFTSTGIMIEVHKDSIGGVSADSAEWTDQGDYILSRRAAVGGDTVVVTDAGEIGIGITNPEAELHVRAKGTIIPFMTESQDGSASWWLHNSYRSSQYGPTLSFRKYHNSKAAPAAITMGSRIQEIYAQGYDGTSLGGGSSIITVATQDWSVGNHGSRMDIFAGSSSATGVISLVSEGFVGINNTTPKEILHINANNDSLQFENLAGTGNGLAINSDGKVYRANIATADSAEWIDKGDYILARRAAAAGDTVVITDDGRIGIGHSGANYRLDIRGASSSSKLFQVDAVKNQIYMTSTGNTASTSFGNSAYALNIGAGSSGGILLTGNGSGTQQTIRMNGVDQYQTNGIQISGGVIGSQTEYFFLGKRGGGTTGNFTFEAPSGGDWLFKEGNVGIGTTLPQEKLHVNAANDSLQFENLAGTGNGLAINSDGKVYRANIATADSAEWIDKGDYILARRAINGGDTIAISDDGALGIGGTPQKTFGVTDLLTINGSYTPTWESELTYGSYGYLNVQTNTSGSGGNDSRFHLQRSRGINSAKTTVQKFDRLGSVYFDAFNGTSYNHAAVMFADVDSINGNDIQGRIFFNTSLSSNITPHSNTRMAITSTGVGIGGVIAPTAQLHINAKNDSLQIDNLAGTGTLLEIDANGKVYKTTKTEVQRLQSYTVASLPAGTLGDVAFVTDANAPAYLAPVVGGGAVVTPVFFNGTNWVAH